MLCYASSLGYVLLAVSALSLSACSATPEPLCSRAEALENQKRCPAPPPPATRKSELSDEEHLAMLENTRYSTTTDLGPEAKAKRQAIRARIEALKAALPAQAPAQQVERHATTTQTITLPEHRAPADAEKTTTQYSVQLGAFKHYKGRVLLAERVTSTPLYSYTLDNGLYALSAGHYTTRHAAELAAVKARNSGFAGAYAITLPADAHILENPY